MVRPIANVRLRPRMSPSLAPASISAAITSVYAVIASWTPAIVVSRSLTICEIDTFMTLLSSTITNCAAARMTIGRPRRVAGRSSCAGAATAASMTVSSGPALRLGAQLGVRGDRLLDLVIGRLAHRPVHDRADEWQDHDDQDPPCGELRAEVPADDVHDREHPHDGDHEGDEGPEEAHAAIVLDRRGADNRACTTTR